MAADLEQLEAVFYSAPVPPNGHTATFLGLVFDRVHFPNVYIPTLGFDPGEVAKEIERLKALPKLRHQDRTLISVMHFVLMPELREFLHFSGEKGQLFGGELREAIRCTWPKTRAPPT
jgi:hypothetical protein